MAAPPVSSTEPLTGKEQLVAWLEQGCKPVESWRIGTEHEKFAFHLEDFRPLAYDEPSGIRDVLEGLARYGDWDPVEEDGNLIALSGRGCCAKGSITLEPGGQVELSGAPLETIHETCREVHTHLRQVKQVAEELKIGMIGLGFQPKWPREAIPWMPKGRYRIMGDYMPKRGRLGIDMMVRTCTVQTNLDFASEACMVTKFRVSLALQPVATALFANSPFSEGKPNGYLSYRSHIWTDTDPDRCGVVPFVFEDGFGFERYVDYLLDVPMYFVYRDGRYIDCAGQSFRAFLEGKLPALPGEKPRLTDFLDHMTTVFPEVRLKRYLEMRGADGGPWHRLCALPALWVGLLYDRSALEAAWDLVKDWHIADHERLREEVPRLGLKTAVPGGRGDRTLQDLAREVLAIAESGLAARNRLDPDDRDERHFLDALKDIAESGITPAERKLALYHGRWNGDIDQIFREFAY